MDKYDFNTFFYLKTDPKSRYAYGLAIIFFRFYKVKIFPFVFRIFISDALRVESIDVKILENAAFIYTYLEKLSSPAAV